MLIIAVALFAGSFFFPGEYQICGATEQAYPKDCTKYHFGPFIFIKGLNIIDAHNGLVTAIATIFIAVFTWTLWSVTGKAVNLAREEFTAANRPKLAVRELYLTPPNPSHSTAEVRYVIANIGSGDAEIVEAHRELQITKNGVLFPLQPIEGDNPIVTCHIKAGGTTFDECGSTIGFAAFTNEISAQKLGEDIKLFFRGFIIYIDKNNVRRRTAFCRAYDDRSRRFVIRNDPDYEYAD